MFYFHPSPSSKNVHRYQCGMPVIIEGETGVGKTALVEMLSKLWNQALLLQWKRQRNHLLDVMKKKLEDIPKNVSDNYQVCHHLCVGHYAFKIGKVVLINPSFSTLLLSPSFLPSSGVCTNNEKAN